MTTTLAVLRDPDREDALRAGGGDAARRTLVSLFAGAGGLDIGLEQAGFTTLLATDIADHACDTLRVNRALRAPIGEAERAALVERVTAQRCYRKATRAELAALHDRLAAAGAGDAHLADAEIVEADVRALSADDILQRTGLRRGVLDLLAGGPPCQPFSRAGKREMTECDDGQLFMEFVRLVDGIRPRFFLFENVKGLVIQQADVARLTCRACGTASLAPFAARAALRDADATTASCATCLTDTPHAATWTRERAGSLAIIQAEFARLGYRCAAQVLNAADYGAPQQRERLFIVGSRDGDAFAWPAATHAERVESKQTVLPLHAARPRQPWRTMRQALYDSGHWRYGVLGAAARLWVKNVVRPHDEPVTWSLDRPSPTIGAHQAAKLAIAPHGVPEAQLARQQWHVLGRRQGDTPPVAVEHEYLSDAELLALQTFPHAWYLHGTRMQRAFQIGNAVPPMLARAVGDALIRAMAGQDAEAGGA